jgi:hypothetical protein
MSITASQLRYRAAVMSIRCFNFLPGIVTPCLIIVASDGTFNRLE